MRLANLRSHPVQPRGFTLIEVLAAIALGGLTLVTAVSLFLAVTQSWIIASRTADETSALLTARYLLQTGINRANETFPDEPAYGIGTPGDDLREDETFFFNADGALFGLSELGPMRVFLKIDDNQLLAILEPRTLAESNGEPALLPLALAAPFSTLHFWFYDPGTDQWEETDSTEDFGEDLNYLGADLAFLEIRSDQIPSLWLPLPSPTTPSTDPSIPPGENAENTPPDADTGTNPPTLNLQPPPTE